MKNVYIILTKSESVPSRLIGLFTHEKFTHSSIAFEDDLSVMYSFARKYSRLPLPAGLVEEKTDCGFYKNQQDIPCAVLKLKVSDKIYFRMKYKVREMMNRRDDYKYSILGLLMCGMNIAADIPDSYFCSQFVAFVLSESGAVEFDKPASLMHPTDFYRMKEFSRIYEGKLFGICG